MMRIMVTDKGEQASLLLYGHCDDMLVFVFGQPEPLLVSRLCFVHQ